MQQPGSNQAKSDLGIGLVAIFLSAAIIAGVIWLYFQNRSEEITGAGLTEETGKEQVTAKDAGAVVPPDMKKQIRNQSLVSTEESENKATFTPVKTGKPARPAKTEEKAPSPKTEAKPPPRKTEETTLSALDKEMSGSPKKEAGPGIREKVPEKVKKKQKVSKSPVKVGGTRTIPVPTTEIPLPETKPEKKLAMVKKTSPDTGISDRKFIPPRPPAKKREQRSPSEGIPKKKPLAGTLAKNLKKSKPVTEIRKKDLASLFEKSDKAVIAGYKYLKRKVPRKSFFRLKREITTQDIVFNDPRDHSVLQVKKWLAVNSERPFQIFFWGDVKKLETGNYFVRTKYHFFDDDQKNVIEDKLFYLDSMGNVIGNPVSYYPGKQDSVFDTGKTVFFPDKDDVRKSLKEWLARRMRSPETLRILNYDYITELQNDNVAFRVEFAGTDVSGEKKKNQALFFMDSRARVIGYPILFN